MKIIGLAALVISISLPALCQLPATASQITEHHVKQLEALRELLESPVAGQLLAPKKRRKVILHSIKTFSVDTTLIDPKDDPAESLKVFLLKSVNTVLGWKIVTMESRPDCVIDILPYGGEYTNLAELTTQCSSTLYTVDCKSSNGSTLSVNCGALGCNSSTTAPRTSYQVIMAGPKKKGLRTVVWKSNKGPAYQLKDSGRWLDKLCTESQAGSKQDCKQRVKQFMNSN